MEEVGIGVRRKEKAVKKKQLEEKTVGNLIIQGLELRR